MTIIIRFNLKISQFCLPLFGLFYRQEYMYKKLSSTSKSGLWPNRPSHTVKKIQTQRIGQITLGCQPLPFLMFHYGCVPDDDDDPDQDHSDHGRSSEPMNPCPEWIHRFISSQRNEAIICAIRRTRSHRRPPSIRALFDQRNNQTNCGGKSNTATI